MIRRITIIFIFLFPAIANALGLGTFELQSNLNQPLEARIDLTSITADELDSLKVNLGSAEDFDKAGLDRPFSLTKLKFEIKETASGADYIRIFSTDPIREPFLNFLVEINWNRGRLLREYTALLDPPTYAPNVSNRPVVEPSLAAPGPVVESAAAPTAPAAPVTRAPAPRPSTSAPVVAAPGSGIDYPVNAIDQADHNVVYNPNYRPSPRTQSAAAPAPAPVTTPQYTGADRTTVRGDTLWQLASQMRPDASVSIQQTMMAMFQANPEAFLDNNINKLKTGQLISNPSLEDARALSKQEAIARVAEHNNLWGQVKQTLAANATERPDSPGDTRSESPQMDSLTEPVADADPELRLLGSSDSEAGVGQGATEQGADSAITGEDPALMQESLMAMESENKELKDKLMEAESLIEDLNRLIVLKEDELAVLKNQLGEPADAELPAETMLEDDELPAEEMAEEMMEETGMAGVLEEATDDAEALMEMEEEAMLEQMDESAETLEEMAEAGDEMLPDTELPDEPTNFIQEEEIPDVDAESEYGPLYDEDAGMAEEFPGEESLPMEDSEFDEPEFDQPVAEALPEESSEGMTTPTASTESDSGLGAVSGILATLQDSFGSFIEFAQQNVKLLGSVLGGLLVLLLGYFGLNKFRGDKAEVLELDEDDDILDFNDDTAEATQEPSADDETEVDLSDSTMVLDQPIDLAATDEIEEPSEDMQSTAALDLTNSATAGFAEPEAPGDADDDPLAEVNVFLAYEHFDQAEDFVKKAIDENPDNLDFHTKLLEVYYAAGDKNSYEEAAKVLNDKVGGSGGHWDMALAMWAEMSPNRGLFEQRADGLDDTQALAPGSAEDALNSGMLDLTATEESGFSGGSLDLTETASDVLDITGQNPMPAKAAEPEDLLDTFSEASGLETLQDENILDVSGALTGDDVLDISGGHKIGEATDNILDLTGGEGGEDILDITAGSQEDLLDVTASTDLDSLPTMTKAEDIKEESTLDFDVQGLDLDIPDTTPVTDSSDRMSDTIERAMELAESNTVETEAATLSPGEDSAVIDFDLPVPGADEAPAELDLDISGVHSVEAADDDADFANAITVELDDQTSGELSEQAKSTLENAKTVEMPRADVSKITAESEEEASLDVDLSDEITVDMDSVGSGTDDLKTDLETSSVDLDLTNEFTLDEENTDSMSQDFDLELQDDDDDDELIPNTELDIDMDGTVEMPKIDYVDDEDDKTVFIPRSESSEEQSLEDEISTKLDLAKAYVELGDNDSAKTILDEIVAEGTDEQKQVAKELLTQVS